MSNLITITTDFGYQDWYVGAMKGVICSINPESKIVDISHSVQAQDVRGGALVLEQSTEYFPAGTVHLCVVDPGVGSQREPCAFLLSNQQIYVVPDNGLITLLLQKHSILKAKVLKNPEYRLDTLSNTFHGRDVFAPAAAHLSQGLDFEKLGSDLDNPVLLDIKNPVLEGYELKGEIIYVDVYGNCITNIKEKEVLRLKAKDWVLEMQTTYSSVGTGEALGYVGSSNYLEIAVNQGHAASQLQLEVGDEVVAILNN